MKLWPHQERLLDLVRAEFRSGKKSVVCVMPTGAGKTHSSCSMTAGHLVQKPEGRVLFLVHRDELLSQTYRAMTEDWGLSVGAVAASTNLPCNPHRPVQVASTQTLLARDLPQDITMVVADECHHYMSAKWSQVIVGYRQRGVPIIGLTATPVRADDLGLGEVFESIVVPTTVKKLIEDGFLTPFELVRPERQLKTGQIAQRPVDAYLEHASGRKAVVFAGNIKAANEFLDQFLAACIPSGMVTGSMEAGERRRVLEAYKNERLRVLINVGVLTEGFDDPPTSCVILARSVGSLSLYLQMCGRGLRVSVKTGKIDAVILDLHGSSHVHGPPDTEHEWSLDGEGIKKKEIKRLDVRFCVVCQVLLEDDCSVCPECGTPRPEVVPPEVVGAKLVKYARKRRETPAEKAATLLRWIAEANKNNYKLGWAYRKFRAVYNEMPSADVQSIVRGKKAS